MEHSEAALVVNWNQITAPLYQPPTGPNESQPDWWKKPRSAWFISRHNDLVLIETRGGSLYSYLRWISCGLRRPICFNISCCHGGDTAFGRTLVAIVLRRASTRCSPIGHFSLDSKRLLRATELNWIKREMSTKLSPRTASEQNTFGELAQYESMPRNNPQEKSDPTSNFLPTAQTNNHKNRLNKRNSFKLSDSSWSVTEQPFRYRNKFVWSDCVQSTDEC